MTGLFVDQTALFFYVISVLKHNAGAETREVFCASISSEIR
jgi:hypothetical protein